MQPTIKDPFDKIQNAEVQTEPFDLLIVDNLLPDDFYKGLAKELEAEDFPSNYARGPYGNKERFGVDITDYSAWNASGRKISTEVHRRNYEALVSGKSDNIKLFVQLLLKNEKDFYSLLGSKLPTERLQDNYFFHVSMIKDSVGYRIKAHCDNQQNIFTILFYAPETDVNKEFGLHVYKVGGDTPVEIGSSHRLTGTRYLESGGAIDFIPNRMIAFAPSEGGVRPSTWHNVNQLSDKLVGTRNSFQMFFYKNGS